MTIWNLDEHQDDGDLNQVHDKNGDLNNLNQVYDKYGDLDQDHL